jgi:hypothetical protein
MTEHTREQPDDAPAAPGEVTASTGVADQLGALRVAAGEADALAAVTVALFDDGDWTDPDPVLVDRVASLLGLMGRAATAVIAAVEKLHGAIADAAPAAGVDRDEW